MMVVFVAVLLGVQFYRGKSNPPAQAPSTPAATTTQTPTQPPPPPPPAQPVGPAASSAAPTGPVVQAGAEATTVVENELYRIQFSNRGGEVTSWILKKYNDSDGKPLDLVHGDAAKAFGYPLSLYTSDGS